MQETHWSNVSQGRPACAVRHLAPRAGLPCSTACTQAPPWLRPCAAPQLPRRGVPLLQAGWSQALTPYGLCVALPAGLDAAEGQQRAGDGASGPRQHCAQPQRVRAPGEGQRAQPQVLRSRAPRAHGGAAGSRPQLLTSWQRGLPQPQFARNYQPQSMPAPDLSAA